MAPPVSPASGVQTQPATASPSARFQNLQAFPPETVQAVYSVPAGADWLSRMNQANGRFLPGLDPTLRTPLASDHDLRQAFAARRWPRPPGSPATRSSPPGPPRPYSPCSPAPNPTPPTPTCRVPDAPSKECNRVGFAAVLALADLRAAGADAKLTAQAEELCRFLRKQVGPDGSIQTTDQSDNPAAKADADAVNVYPGLAIQALAASHRAKPDPGKQAALAKAVGHYRGVFKAQPTRCWRPRCCRGSRTTASRPRTRRPRRRSPRWPTGCAAASTPGPTRGRRRGPAGSARVTAGPTNAEPGSEAAVRRRPRVRGAAHPAVAPDLTRFQRYRQAAVDGLAFARGFSLPTKTPITSRRGSGPGS